MTEIFLAHKKKIIIVQWTGWSGVKTENSCFQFTIHSKKSILKYKKKKKNSRRTIYPLALIGFMSDVLLFTFVNSFGFAPEGKNGYNEWRMLLLWQKMH